ncbi:MAG: hypothetical protein IKV53_05980 [Clostridia bacterium]|nr:hypothetical protein [Clostridia bacterium]
MKRLLFCVLTLLCLITLLASAEEPFLRFEFSHNVAESVQKDDTVVCTVKYSDINPLGLSSVELTVEYSDGLEYNRDASATGLQSAWTLWEPNVSDNSIKFGIVDDSVVTPGVNDMTLTFSFKVIADGFDGEYIRIAENNIYDFDINEVESVAEDINAPAFVSNLPEMSVENKGASLRINNAPALRFGAEITSIPANAEFGMLVSESDKLDGELTHSTENADLLELKPLAENVFATEAFAIASNTKSYTFRPFVKLVTDSGSDYYVYFDSLERSAEQVALAELEIENDAEKVKMLKAFCSNT